MRTTRAIPTCRVIYKYHLQHEDFIPEHETAASRIVPGIKQDRLNLIMNLILFLILVAGLIHHTGIKQNRVKLNKKRVICHNDKIVLLSTICFLEILLFFLSPNRVPIFSGCNQIHLLYKLNIQTRSI